LNIRISRGVVFESSRLEEDLIMTKCNSRHSPTTKTPVERRERTPHRSGQEYEYGETPQTGLGDAGVGADPDRGCARHAPHGSPRIDRELEDEEELRSETTPLQQGVRERNN
jgi:hypothetical protein